MMPNAWSGFAIANASVASPRRKPTVTMTSQPSSMNAWMFGS
jgi:hypothetical protein